MITCYRHHRWEKREVKHAFVITLVMTCTGGSGLCATVFLGPCSIVDREAPLRFIFASVVPSGNRSLCTSIAAGHQHITHYMQTDLEAADLAMAKGQIGQGCPHRIKTLLCSLLPISLQCTIVCCFIECLPLLLLAERPAFSELWRPTPVPRCPQQPCYCCSYKNIGLNSTADNSQSSLAKTGSEWER